MEPALRTTIKHVKPILSLTPGESRRRTLALYKTWFRQIPIIAAIYCLPKTEAECKKKLREIFRQNKDIRDLRVIDVMLIKGQMELQECVNHWKPVGHVLNYWKDTVKPKPKDFMSRFLSGHD